jgi:hypothetical protein
VGADGGRRRGDDRRLNRGVRRERRVPVGLSEAEYLSGSVLDTRRSEPAGEMGGCDGGSSAP